MTATVRIPWAQASAQCRAALRRLGLSESDTDTVCEVLLDAELTGRSGHGLVRLPAIANRLRETDRGSQCIRIVRDQETAVSVDAGGALGFLTGVWLARLAMARLQDRPLVALGCRGATHAGALGYYPRLVAEAGPYWALAMTDSSPLLAPHGAKAALLGTNPIAFACATDRHPLVADLSPAASTYGDLLRARSANQPIPEQAAIDAQGRPTTDPQAALDGALLPIAGPKGSALAFLVQVMSGVLCGADAIPTDGLDYGFFMLAGRMDTFADSQRVREELETLATAMREAGAQCPGDRSQAHRAKVEKEGIEIASDSWKRVQILAGAD